MSQSNDGVDLALYLDAGLVERLNGDDPIANLHPGNVVDFCTALEGVSHFVYLAWNASLDRAVRPLELELQAEVDKYIAIATLAREQRARPSAELHPWLFERARFDTALDDDELQRYRDANRYAGKYCMELQSRYLHSPARESLDGMMGDIRRFYRLTLADKIRRIDR